MPPPSASPSAGAADSPALEGSTTRAVSCSNSSATTGNGASPSSCCAGAGAADVDAAGSVEVESVVVVGRVESRAAMGSSSSSFTTCSSSSSTCDTRAFFFTVSSAGLTLRSTVGWGSALEGPSTEGWRDDRLSFLRFFARAEADEVCATLSAGARNENRSSASILGEEGGVRLTSSNSKLGWAEIPSRRQVHSFFYQTFFFRCSPLFQPCLPPNDPTINPNPPALVHAPSPPRPTLLT